MPYRAIEINGLTRERLAELGTSDKKEAISEFLSDVKKSILVVAHNIGFDFRLIFLNLQGVSAP